MKYSAIAAACLICGLLGGPAHAQRGVQDVSEHVAGCRARIEALDRRIESAGVRDAGYQRLPGFPYLRADRLIASFVTEVEDLERFGELVWQLRDNDIYAREIELINLGVPMQERVSLLNDVRFCGGWLSRLELIEPADRERLLGVLQAAAAPAADPQGGRQAQADRARRVQEVFSQPAASQGIGTGASWWSVSTNFPVGTMLPDHGLGVANRDMLGRMGFTEDQWRALAARYAPVFLIENSADDDVPGAIRLTKRGAAVDRSTPALYYQPGYARLGTRSLLQFSYFLWFDDGAEHRLSGLIWRVTLDADGKPLVYDSISASGFDQLWFPTEGFGRMPADPTEALVPQSDIPEEFAVRLSAVGHEVERLVPLKEAPVRMRKLELRSYEELLTLPVAANGTRSLFDGRGFVTQPREDSKADPRTRGAWPARQWGHHPTSLTARYYFDDPRLIERLFVLPPVEASTRQQQGSDSGGGPGAAAPP